MSTALGRATWYSRCSPGACTGAMAGCLLILLALPTFQTLVASWQNNPDYSHGWLLLPILIWLTVRAKPCTAVGPPQRFLGAFTMLAGGLLHLATMLVQWPLIDYFAWVMLLRGLALCLSGREAARRCMPVLGYAILLFPMPATWMNELAMVLQDGIAQIAEWGLSIFWVCHRRGHQIYLAGLDEPLSVAVECSGVRQLMIFLAMAWLLAFVVRGPLWRKMVLVAASLPLAIATNVARVLILAVLVRLLGPGAIAGWLHDLPLLLTLPLGALILWWCYGQLDTGKPPHNALPNHLQPASSAFAPRAFILPLGVLGTLLCLQLALHLHLSGAEPLPPMQHFSFNELPWHFGPWKGMTHPEEDKVKAQAAFADESLVRAFANDRGLAVAVYLVYSTSGHDRKHHPEICLRDAGGAAELKSDRSSILLKDNASRKAERFRYQRHRDQRTLVYYWHYTILPQAQKHQSLLQHLYLKQCDHWPSITVQVQTNMPDPASWKEIETTLLPELDRWLAAQLPPSAVVGNGRLPVRWTGEH